MDPLIFLSTDLFKQKSPQPASANTELFLKDRNDERDRQRKAASRGWDLSSDGPQGPQRNTVMDSKGRD